MIVFLLNGDVVAFFCDFVAIYPLIYLLTYLKRPTP